MSSPENYAKRKSETVRDVAADIIQLLRDASESVGVAESLTAGGLMEAITSVGGASALFRGGVVSYSAELKLKLLNVDADLVKEQGTVHEEVVKQMAIGARKITETDTPTTWGISTTGVGGPDPQDDKPAGTVFIGIAHENETTTYGPFWFAGGPDRVRQSTILEALTILRDILQERTGGSS